MAAHPGEKHHNAVLKKRQVIKLRQEPHNTGFISRLREKVTYTTIRNAKLGITWRCVNREARPVRR